MNAKVLLTLITLSALATVDLIAQGFDRPGPRDRRDRQESIREQLRPQITDEQRAALDAHRANVQAKHVELNEILKTADTTGTYTALSENDDLTREERHELVTLRRELLAGSADAQAKLDEIKAGNAAFRDENPAIGRRPEIRPRIAEIKEINQELRALLSTDEAIAALLAIEEKTEEQIATLRGLREDFIANSEEAQDLIAEKQQLKSSVRDRIRRIRRHHRADRPHRPRPSDQTDSTTDSANTE